MTHLPTALGATGRHREDPAVAAHRAGQRGRHAEPTTEADRRRIYQWQNNCGRLTPRQRRRVEHKRNQAHKRREIAGKQRWDNADQSWMDGETP